MHDVSGSAEHVSTHGGDCNAEVVSARLVAGSEFSAGRRPGPVSCVGILLLATAGLSGSVSLLLSGAGVSCGGKLQRPACAPFHAQLPRQLPGGAGLCSMVNWL